MPSFRVIIAGTRTFADYALMAHKLDQILSRKLPDVVILSGCCRGADQLGERYAAERGLPVERYTAEWERLGKRAGPIRNQQMVDSKPDAVVAAEKITARVRLDARKQRCPCRQATTK